MPWWSSAHNLPRALLRTCGWTKVMTSESPENSRKNATTSHTSGASQKRSSMRWARNALSGEALGGGAHAGLAFEVPGDSGALREKSRQLSGVDQGCQYLAVVPASAPSIPFEIVSKRQGAGQAVVRRASAPLQTPSRERRYGVQW